MQEAMRTARSSRLVQDERAVKSAFLCPLCVSVVNIKPLPPHRQASTVSVATLAP